MRLFGRANLEDLAWPWAASTFMAAVGSVLHWYDDDVWVVVYGYTPLFALPFILCLTHLWPRGPLRTSSLMAIVCFAAQWCFIHSHTNQVLVLLNGMLSAIIVGLISTRIGHQVQLKLHAFLLLAILGSCATVPLIAFGPRSEISVIGSVWFWQFSVGTILVMAVSQSPATRE